MNSTIERIYALGVALGCHPIDYRVEIHLNESQYRYQARLARANGYAGLGNGDTADKALAALETNLRGQADVRAERLAAELDTLRKASATDTSSLTPKE